MLTVLFFVRKHNVIVLFVFIVIITILPRVIYFFGGYDFFEVEPAYDFLAVKKIVVDNKLILTGGNVGGIGGFHKGPLYYYLLAIPFSLTKGDPFSGKVFMFIQSILTVAISYILVNKMLNMRTAVFISFFLAISPYLIFQAGRIWNPFMAPIFVVIFLYFLYKVFQKKYRYMYLVAFILGVMTSFEIAIAGTLFAQLIIFTLYFLYKKILPLKYPFLSILIIIFTLSPYFLFDLNNNFYNAKGVLKMISLTKNQTKNITNIFSNEILNNRAATFSWNFQSTFTPHRIVGPFLFILIYLSAYFYIKNKKNSVQNRLFVLYLASSPLFIFIIFLLYPGDIFAWWLLELTVFYCYLAGILAGYYYRRNFLFKLIVIIIIAAFLKAAIYRAYLDYLNGFTYPPKKYTIRLLEPVDYIFKDANKEPFDIKLVTLRPPSYIYDYDYLIWWLGYAKYKFIPVQEYLYFSDNKIKNLKSNQKLKNKLFYILIEYDSLNKIILENWINNDKTGTVNETKYFQDRYIVQKRSI